MVEAVVNVVVDQLMSATTEWLTDEISLINSVEKELENMSTKMQTIQKVLHDAENKSMKEKIVKEWLEELQDVAYDMEDMMDEWNTRVLKQKIKEASNGIISSSYKKLNCFGNPLKQVGWRRDLARRIRKINERMNMIFGDIENLNLISKALGNYVMSEASNAIDRTTTSSVEESQVHGRDRDKKYLLSKVLCQNSDDHNNALVVPIVGPGGLGKTTLAQVVYNDEKVREEFDNRIWVCVSNPFDEVKVARGILEGVQVRHDSMIYLETLHESIKKSLSKKKFLLVLDDVWEEDSGKWERLRMSLKLGAPESRIIVTTRSEEVAKIMSSTITDIFRPTLISNAHCWLLMRQVAFQGKGDEDYTKLEDIGKRIANKCKGLPLAAKVLGGLLRAKDTFEEWEEVLNSQIWNLEKAEMEIFPHMFLSYKELSSALKRCFSLCALFPKDYSIKTEQLISLWMAQIHLESRSINDNMMVTGQRYVKFLKSSAFIEEGYHSDSVKMHDIMHDFALHLSGHEFQSLVGVENNDSLETQAHVKHMKARHLFVDGTINTTSFCDVGKFRTCFIKHVPKNVTLDLLKQLKVVRALYLQFCALEEVPEDIGNLIHLRTLDLSNNSNLCELPETIGELYNLEYLWLRYVHNRAKMLPKSLFKLNNLQELKEFRVMMGKSNFGMLKNLNKLGGALEIVFCSIYSDEADAKDAKLTNKKHITELSFDFGSYKVTNGVFEALEAPPGIQILSISKFKGERFLPNWITSLSYLKEITLSIAVEALSIPPLGRLPSLERLCIEYFSVLKFIGRDFLGIEDNTNNEQVIVSFPKLLKLKVSDCPKLEAWEDMKPEDEDKITVMPKLTHLEIIGCNNLKELPHWLFRKATSLEELTSSLSFCVQVSSVQQQSHLQVLNIREFEGTSLPSWILSLNLLTKLHIRHAVYVKYLPALGKLPCLEDLCLSNFFELQCISREFLGIDNKGTHLTNVAFPKLVNFSLYNCNHLKEWKDIEAEEAGTPMPKLESLIIVDCNRLEALPRLLLCKALMLNKLEIKSSRLLQESIKEYQELILQIQVHRDSSSMYGISDQHE